MLYNTAVKASGNLANNINRILDNEFKDERFIVFQHDICKGVDSRFRICDAIHSEIAWRAGYSKFTDNTIAKDTTFNEYLDGIVNTCRDLRIPSFIVCGKAMIKRMDPDNVIPIKYTFHNCDAYYAIYNYDRNLDGVFDEYSGRNWVASNFNCILDPCCGYGIIANDIIAHNKRGVLSDINVECLEYINNNYMVKE